MELSRDLELNIMMEGPGKIGGPALLNEAMTYFIKFFYLIL